LRKRENGETEAAAGSEQDPEVGEGTGLAHQVPHNVIVGIVVVLGIVV